MYIYVYMYMYVYYIIPWVLNNTQHPSPSTAHYPHHPVVSCAVGAGFVFGPSLLVLPSSHVVLSMSPTSAGVSSPESAVAPRAPPVRSHAPPPPLPTGLPFCRRCPRRYARFLLRHLGSGVEHAGAQLLPSASDSSILTSISGSSSSIQSTPA
jgi:hypothetical protein